LGLEGAGYIVDSETLKPLRKGCTLLNGGGYAQYATVDERHVIELPADFDLIRAAAIPEAWITAYQTLRYIAKFA
jgi:NADPH:quinone reductase-like Zn-dependent oxidoreductase